MHRSPLVLLIIGAAIIRYQLPFLRRTHAKEDGDYPQGCLHYFFMDFSKIPMESAILDEWPMRNWCFSGDKSLFLGLHGRAEVRKKYIAGAWGNYCMCRKFLFDVYTWRIGQLQFLQRMYWIFLEDSSDNFITQLWCKKRRFDRKKRPLCFLKNE